VNGMEIAEEMNALVGWQRRKFKIEIYEKFKELRCNES
jgi:hypothetical protein